MKVIEIATGRELRSVSLGSGMIPSVEFDAKGRHVVVSGPGSALNAINVDTGAITVIDAGIGYLPEYRFSRDGRYMAAGLQTGGGLVIWDAKTWKELRRIPGLRSSVAFSFDGRYLAAVDPGGRLKVWETATGAEAATVGEGLNPDLPLEFTFEHKILVAGSDGTMRLFGSRPGGAPKGGR